MHSKIGDTCMSLLNYNKKNAQYELQLWNFQTNDINIWRYPNANQAICYFVNMMHYLMNDKPKNERYKLVLLDREKRTKDDNFLVLQKAIINFTEEQKMPQVAGAPSHPIQASASGGVPSCSSSKE